MARLFCLTMPEPNDFRLGCQFYTSVAIKAANDLQNALQMDEKSFRRITPALWQDPRPAFIYSVLDEVQKAGVSIKDWSDKLGESERRPEFTDHLIRIVTQWQQDEQSFRARKLSEILVDLICFSETNEPEYYRDYLRLKELDTVVRSLTDQHEFFGFKRRNTEHHVGWMERDIKTAEREGINVSKRWYLKSPESFQEKWETRGIRFSSFRQRYIRILNIALPNELAIIGKSYVHAYGMSADVHFAPHDISSNFDPDDVYMGIDRVGLLCYAIVIRCQLLLSIIPEDINTQIRKMHDENAEPARLVAGLKQEIAQVGDFVWAHGDICQVAETLKSKYGYTSYLLKYAERPPIPDIAQDYFAAGEVRLVARRSLAEEALHQLQTDPEVDEETRARFREMATTDRDALMGQAVARLWRMQQQIVTRITSPQANEIESAGTTDTAGRMTSGDEHK
jgi:hypothetical protein